ncbi:hypothetical protein D9619_003709 [Psilocybe cf. subviscida]|uniref:NACHT domain-containing protein n=1 Tax=Psilocybe cf. subviscida TaxID=2480587 RepID=A0A8H5AX06_9AGAR|nr:hypothetical protein D9619_003709 [Psilocybe cf. subviscida]
MCSTIRDGLDSRGSLFQGAKAIHISGGSFYAYGSSEGRTQTDAALSILNSRMEPGAAYDAAAREDVPKCHENTRVAIVEGIEKWSTCHEDYHARPIMWMYGPAGSGKTTIMQTVAATFSKEGALAGSFFFSRSAPNRPKTKVNFVITIAYQLWFNVPAIRDHMVTALADSSLVDKSLIYQLDVLIIRPLNKLDALQIGGRLIFMVDGLDECESDSCQRDILDLLAHFTRQTLHSFPVLIASRQTSAIQAFFSDADITGKTWGMPIDNDYRAYEDIRKVVVAAFDNIKLEHPSKGSLRSQWPAPSDINTIVQRSSGQFIYASVVMKYIAEHSRHPERSLQTILDVQASGGDPWPYKELDAIYTEIMSTVEPENLPFVMDFIGCLSLPSSARGVSIFKDACADYIPSQDWDTVFMAEPGTTQARLNRLRPLITPSWFREKLTFRISHASFVEYLLDMSRSGEFFLDMRMVHCRLAHHWLKVYTAHLKNYNGCTSSPGQQHDCAVKPVIQFMPHKYKGTQFDTFIWHCCRAKITLELLKDIVLFDIEAALSWMADHDTSIRGANFWKEVLHWINFVIWLQEQAPPAHQDLIDTFSKKLQSAIYAVVSLHSTASDTITEFAVFISLWTQIYRDGDVEHQTSDMGVFKPITDIWGAAGVAIKSNNTRRHERGQFCGRYICHVSCRFLSRVLTPALSMDGQSFLDGTHYSNMALRLSKDYMANPECPAIWRTIPLFLSKASPNKELGLFIRDNLLQIPRKYDSTCLYRTHPESLRGRNRVDTFMAFCIYVYPTDIQKDSLMKNGHAEFASSLMNMAPNAPTLSFRLNLPKPPQHWCDTASFHWRL